VPLGILYQLFVAQGLLGEWSLIREWGRVGSPGTVRKEWFATEEEAITARQTLYYAKQKKGYQTVL
jgi:predicted DNA-binding WGR domain protein